MIVVVTTPEDRAARTFAHDHAREEVLLLTPADLSTLGWFHTVPPCDSETAVVDRRAIPSREIRGVITRVGTIHEGDLPDIASAERRYVAAEMTAFLASWLSTLPCPLLNPPVTPLLTSPLWPRERWAMVATRRHIPVKPVWRRATLDGFETRSQDGLPEKPHSPEEATSTITIVGGRCFGDQDASRIRQARALADEAGVRSLVVHFRVGKERAAFLDAHPWVNLQDPEISEAVVDLLTGRRSCLARR